MPVAYFNLTRRHHQILFHVQLIRTPLSKLSTCLVRKMHCASVSWHCLMHLIVALIATTLFVFALLLSSALFFPNYFHLLRLCYIQNSTQIPCLRAAIPIIVAKNTCSIIPIVVHREDQHPGLIIIPLTPPIASSSSYWKRRSRRWRQSWIPVCSSSSSCAFISQLIDCFQACRTPPFSHSTRKTTPWEIFCALAYYKIAMSLSQHTR